MKRARIRIKENTPSKEIHDLFFQYKKHADHAIKVALTSEMFTNGVLQVSDRYITLIMPWELVGSIEVKMVDVANEEK